MQTQYERDFARPRTAFARGDSTYPRLSRSLTRCLLTREVSHRCRKKCAREALDQQRNHAKSRAPSLQISPYTKLLSPVGSSRTT